MTASPIIEDATAYPAGSDVYVLSLVSNGNQGVVKYTAGNYASGACTEDTANEVERCEVKTEHSLRSKFVTMKAGSSTRVCLHLRACSGTENCTDRTCTAWPTSPTSSMTDIVVVAFNSTAPGTPGGLTITPGSGQLTISWNNVTDPTGLSSVFAYYVKILSGTTLVVSGYTSGLLNERSIRVTGLTNATTYTIQVSAISHNNEIGTAATGTGTPAVPTTPTCTSITDVFAYPVSIIGINNTLGAVITPAAAGKTVQFKDGDTVLGSGTTNATGDSYFDWTPTVAKVYSIKASVGTECISVNAKIVNVYTCLSIMADYGTIIKKYDADKDGKISSTERAAAVTDYLAGKITESQNDAVMYFNVANCEYTPTPVEGEPSKASTAFYIISAAVGLGLLAYSLTKDKKK